ncbi:MAG: zinc-binding dehydrogenase [Rhizobacter sp.]|nr:zinc-binding dehydrogenase [Chlorobiales bacterium]
MSTELSHGLKQALEIMLSGRTLTSREALEIGLIDELTEHDALSRATELGREFIERNGNSALAQVFAAHRQSQAAQETPRPFPEALLQDADIARLISQLEHSGRGDAVEKILNAVRTGYELGLTQGSTAEAAAFAEAVVDKSGGKAGIEAFLEKRSKPLPPRPWTSRPGGLPEESELLKSGALLPSDAPFYAGITRLPTYQYAMAITRDAATGEASQGDPIKAEKKIIVPVPAPSPNEVLLYMLTSEVNFNDIWAITGIPVSQVDNTDKDIYITGSGGLALIAAVGSEVLREGRLKVADMVTVYSGQSNLLSPAAGLDPMFEGFKIQGYETGDGSHQQFMIAQAPQCHKKPQDLTLEAAGSYILNLGTVFRALFTTLEIQQGKRIFIEGAATGTGMEALKVSVKQGLHATGLVSNADRAASIKALGAMGTINRTEKKYETLFEKVPEKKNEWKKWEKSGEALMKTFKQQNGGKLADYVISHAGETSFPRSFQLLAAGGTLAFYGASGGYHFTFIGKKGKATPDEMLTRIRLRANEAVLTYYGTSVDKSGIVDSEGLEIIETLRERKARIVVVCYTNAQKEFVGSLGFGDAVKGIVSLEALSERLQEDFQWPQTMSPLPDPRKETEAFKTAVQAFNDKVFKPIGGEVGKSLRSPDNPRGYPDAVFERAGHDALSVSATIVKPFTGRIVYSEDLGGIRQSFYAPQVWMRQRRIYMPTAGIFGTHLCNAYEVTVMNDMIDAGIFEITDPLVASFEGLPQAHQEMWENKHKAGNYVCNHALPVLGLKTKEELYQAWSVKK